MTLPVYPGGAHIVLAIGLWSSGASLRSCSRKYPSVANYPFFAIEGNRLHAHRQNDPYHFRHRHARWDFEAQVEMYQPQPILLVLL